MVSQDVIQFIVSHKNQALFIAYIVAPREAKCNIKIQKIEII